MCYPGAVWTHPCADTSVCSYDQSFTTPPTSTPIFTAITSRIHCKHARCNLYESNKMSRGFIISRALFCTVCQIFNHAVKHTYHIERALRTRPRLRHSLAKLTYVPEQNSVTTSTRLLLITLREHPAQDISSLLDNLRSQHAPCYNKATDRRPQHIQPSVPPHSCLSFCCTNSQYFFLSALHR